VTLPALAAGHPAAVDVERYRLPAGPTAANPPHAAAAIDREREQRGNTVNRQQETYALNMNNN